MHIFKGTIFFCSHVVHPNYSLPSSTPSTVPHPQIHSNSISLQKRAGIPLIWTKHTIKDAIRLGTNTYMKANWCNPVEVKGSQEQAKESETFSLPLWGVPRTLHIKQLQHVCRGPTTDPCRIYDCCFSYCENLLDSVGLMISFDVLNFSVSYNLSSFSLSC